MVSKRFTKRLDDLRGLSRIIAEQRIRYESPPFYKMHLDYNVLPSEKVDPVPFAAGDRVQMIRGPQKGMIGKISQVYESGNAVFVEGLGQPQRVVMPKEIWFQGQTKPVISVPKLVPYKDIRLVAKILNDEGKEEDVVIHSFELSGRYFDKELNNFRPIRRALHDKRIVIPWPIEKVEKSNSTYSTDPSVVEERTFYPQSILESTIPYGAVAQIRNVYSRHKRERYVRPITELDMIYAEKKERKMPIPPATKKLLEDLSKLPPKKTVPFTKEVEEYISAEMKKGLQRRLHEETAALDQYR
jgi:large subunit ribosomal protein L24